MKKRWLAVLAVALGSGIWAQTTQQTPEQEAARAVMLQGKSAYDAQHYAAALPLLRQAAAAGDMKAPRYIGLMYLNGQGVGKNAQAAVQAFGVAASRGDITSQYWLGYCYQHGIGVGQNAAAALGWYLISAQRGDEVAAPAMRALGDMYAAGEGVAKDAAAAQMWYERADKAEKSR